jgi:hypothetical protein
MPAPHFAVGDTTDLARERARRDRNTQLIVSVSGFLVLAAVTTYGFVTDVLPHTP